LKLLNNNGRAELGMKLLHSFAFKNCKDMNLNHLKLNTASSIKLKPNPAEIGISSSVEPDFLIDKYKVIGDVKSGTEFKPFHQLTCTGYALAYENEKKKDINWGIIYFFPTKNPSAYVKPVTFAQIYIFPIDDNLRRWFLDFRNQDYGTISKNRPPKFPKVKNRQHCSYCKFNDQCKNQGLKV
jgi:CRISPR/Cas system-associated exonuclease Cas4 (RecB family)